jgi:hypothetical protein
MKNSDLYDSGPNTMTDKQFKQVQREFQKARMAEHEAQEAAKRVARAEMALGGNSDVFDNDAFDAQTAKELAEFNKFATKRDAAERSQIEYLNGQAFIQANPRYIANPTNSNNITAYLKQNGLTATPQNLQLAFESLTPILDLKPEVVRPPRVYTQAELMALPMEDTDPWGLDPNAQPTFEQVCNENAQRNAQLENVIVSDTEESW